MSRDLPPRPPLLGTLALLVLIGGCGPDRETGRRVPSGEPRTVVLVSIDTLRPGRLSVYGGPDDASPRIAELADQALVCDDALAPAPWTLPSHMSMLTGLDPLAHGVKRGGEVRLPERAVTLAELLAADGFRTAAFTDGGFVSARWGFDQGFEIYEDERSSSGPNGFARLLPAALDWIRARAGAGEDMFVFVHTFDVHGPYDEGDPEVLARFRGRPVEPGPRDHRLVWTRYVEQQRRMRVPQYGRIGELLNDYDAGVFEADRGVGRIVDLLRETGRFENALVIVTSDHGESLLDRGLHVGHGIGLTDDELAIPMIIRFPGNQFAGQRLATTIDLVDLAPTVCDALGLPPDAYMQGESLMALAEGRARRREYILGQSANTESYFLIRAGYKYISPLGLDAFEIARRHLGFFSPENPNYTECFAYTFGGDDGPELCYDVVGDPLAVRDHLPHAEQLYRRADDPGELHDLAAGASAITDEMRRFLIGALERSDDVFAELFSPETDEAPPFDPHATQQLAQLGYMDVKAQGGQVNKRDYLKMSRTMREEQRRPHHPPDMTRVEAADARVHELRLALRGGGRPTDAKEILDGAVHDYIEWAAEWCTTDDLRWWPRIGWRLFECKRLAEEAGASVDYQEWRRQALDRLDPSERGGEGESPR